jgi:nucleoside 2-deoxyribosyltransferase
MYEIGYARSQGKPVIVYCENEPVESLKMMQGSECRICDDFVTAIYHACWDASAS